MRQLALVPGSAALLVCLLLPGCRVDTTKDGTHKDVNIATPFGSLHAKTNDASTNASVGITPYPGAVPIHKDDDDGDNTHSADVNFSFGNFKLGVHARELQTQDPEPKVLAFYRQDMKRYGVVITCRGDKAEGTPTRTDAGLTCDDKGNRNSGDDDLQLRAGSEQHQHIVGVHVDKGGTRIGLVALDLPGDLTNHGSDTQE